MTDEQIIAATVRLPKRGGQGVLIPGGLILTAAHCVDWSNDGSLVMGAFLEGSCIENIETSGGEKLRVASRVVELVADIAVLGCLDDQMFPDEWQAFDSWCESTTAVPLSSLARAAFVEFAVRIRPHEGKWIQGSGQFCGENPPNVWIKADEQIRGGTSGGPVVDEFGELVGVVSFTNENCGKCDGSIARPRRTLSVGLMEEIDDAQSGNWL